MGQRGGAAGPRAAPPLCSKTIRGRCASSKFRRAVNSYIPLSPLVCPVIQDGGADRAVGGAQRRGGPEGRRGGAQGGGGVGRRRGGGGGRQQGTADDAVVVRVDPAVAVEVEPGAVGAGA